MKKKIKKNKNESSNSVHRILFCRLFKFHDKTFCSNSVHFSLYSFVVLPDSKRYLKERHLMLLLLLQYSFELTLTINLVVKVRCITDRGV